MKAILSIVLLLQLTSYIKCDYSAFKFNFENCGPPKDPLQILALSVSPDPVHFPGVLNITAAVALGIDVASPIAAAVKITKKVGPFTVEIPCVDNIGSCNYNDICTLLPPSPSQCPDFFIKNNIPCTCPFPKGKYSVQNLAIQIEVNEPVPNGQYDITADISSKTTHIGCIHITANYQK